MAVPTEAKKTSKRNKTVISRGVVGIVYSTELCRSYIQIQQQLSVFEIYHISHHSMVPNQKIKDTLNLLLKI